MTMKLRNLSRTHQLVLGSIMAAINVLFALLSSYIFAFGLLVMLFLPLASVIVAINIDLKYYPVYFLGTLFLSLIINLANVENTLFFLLPILASGLAFGFFIRRNLPDILILLFVSAVNLITLLITIPIINLIYDIDFLAVFAGFIGFNNISFGKLILPSILTLLAFMQTLITLLIITLDATYFKLELKNNAWPYASLLNILLLGLVTLLMFFYQSLALAILFISVLFAAYVIVRLFQENIVFAGLITIFGLALMVVGVALFQQRNLVPYYFGIIMGVIPIVIIDNLWLYINNVKKRGIK